MTQGKNLSQKYSNILPAQAQTLFLRACLWKGKAGCKAWTEWENFVEDPIERITKDNRGLKRLLPLLLLALERNQVSVDRYLQTRLRTAYFREEMRRKIYKKICREVLSALTSSNTKTIVLKGAALAETVYADAVCRHCHDIEILANENELDHLLNLAQVLDFTRSSEIINSKWENISLIHKTGLPLVYRRYLLQKPNPCLNVAELWARSINQIIFDIPIRILSPADNLLHICTNAFFYGRLVPIGWVCDAWFIIDRYPDLDWNFLLEFVQRANLELPLLLTLGYLAKDLEASIPSVLLDRLRATVSKTDGNFHESLI
jgi:hypothetical protein